MYVSCLEANLNSVRTHFFRTCFSVISHIPYCFVCKERENVSDCTAPTLVNVSVKSFVVYKERFTSELESMIFLDTVQWIKFNLQHVYFSN